ncbi:MAG TPA: SMC family ATPase [Trebonia sp.]|nr:SMC family ATPase [Trebonia sp.]
MRPHRLRVTAFGAFAGTEQVVFDDLDGLFLLHGETGAGKTTLLDAIAFALYGRVPGERGNARRLRSDHAAAGTVTEVEFEATIGSRRLRVTRRPEQARRKKSGSGHTTEPASVRLAELSAAGDWESKSTRIGEADAEIENLMGMSAAQFFQVVLLPQGEFARFLRADAKDKEALLQKLFGTDRFRRAEDWLADRRRAADKDVAAAEGTLVLLVAQTAQAAGVPVPAPEEASAEPPEPAAWAAGLAARAAAEHGSAASLVTLRKTELDAALAGRGQAEQLAERQRRRRDALRRQQELLEATPELAELSGPAAAGPLRAGAQRQQAQAGRLEALRVVARQADAEDGTAAAARGRAARLAGDLAEAEAETLLRQASRAGAGQARDAAAAAAAALPAAQAEAVAARAVAADFAALVREHGKRLRLREAHLTARERWLTAQAQAQRIRGARIDGMRAELAAQMTDGSPCPVCGSLDHPDPVDADSFPPVSRDEEDAAFRAASDAAQAAEQAGQAVAAADAVLSDLAKRLAGAGLSALSPDAGLDVLTAAAGTASSAAERLEAEADLLGSTAASLAARQRELDELDKSIAAGHAWRTELAEKHAAALAEAAAAGTRAADRRAELAAQLGGAGDLEAAISAATRLAEAFAQAATVADQLAGHDLDVPLDPPAPVEEAREAAEAAQGAYDAAVDALGQARHQTGQLTLLQPRLEDAVAALHPVRERAAQVRHLADLANGTGAANQYKMTLSSFVLAARLEEVAAAASERLLTMTAGRYSLVHSDARKGNAKAGLSLLACDAWTGIDRDTATLSGGETFLASLALALGLADVVTGESAGSRMEALFVDEGFGTLDEETLDEVMNVLDGLRAGGRIVGIVSHVSELRQRIPARIHVRKSRSGSHVEVTAG